MFLALIKLSNSQKFFGALSSLTNKGFVEIESEEKREIFNSFYLFFVVFSWITFSLLIYLSLLETEGISLTLSGFTKVLTYVFLYAATRLFAEKFIVKLFSIQNAVAFFVQSKQIYLFSISAYIWFLLLFYIYGNLNISILWSGALFLFFGRFLAIILNNKNLIFNKLFYFILYLCAFEIAPLLILYIMITK